MPKRNYPRTPDGRYFVVRERLWRTSNPNLRDDERLWLVKELMRARRAVRDARGEAAIAIARESVALAKIALGERGPPWWDDGSPAYNRRMVSRSPYADWYRALIREPN